MKFCRFSTADSVLPRFGLLEANSVTEITGAPWATDPWRKTSSAYAVDQVRLLAPVTPSKIVCVGRNYAAHAAELGNDMPEEPLIFLKPSTSIVGPGEPIILPRYSQKVEHESELALVVARRASRLSDSDDPHSYLLGYSCLNDVTARDLQKSDVQFTRSKGFDTFCPIGPHIESQLNPDDVLVECRVNGTLRQSARSSLMAFRPAFLLRWISRMMTLNPGDVIATGTPSGVGPLVAGDRVEVSVEGIGVLRNPVHPPQA
jgi:2-keto-4-pentenoate hydratase/2-oxohepta-3-ene-1,7-dioic acid hydratase in catechol pathway